MAFVVLFDPMFPKVQNLKLRSCKIGQNSGSAQLAADNVYASKQALCDVLNLRPHRAGAGWLWNSTIVAASS
jgi:hypothetical protein